jgi:hypothetical protein
VPPTPAGIHVFLHVYNLATCLALFSLARAVRHVGRAVDGSATRSRAACPA